MATAQPVEIRRKFITLELEYDEARAVLATLELAAPSMERIVLIGAVSTALSNALAGAIPVKRIEDANGNS